MVVAGIQELRIFDSAALHVLFCHTCLLLPNQLSVITSVLLSDFSFLSSTLYFLYQSDTIDSLLTPKLAVLHIDPQLWGTNKGKLNQLFSQLADI